MKCFDEKLKYINLKEYKSGADETRTAVRKAGVGDDLPYIYMLLAPEFRRFGNEKRSNFRYKVVGPAANRQRDMTNLQQLLLGRLPNSPFSSLAFAAADSQTKDERTVRQNTSPYYI